jgi:uncharacterized protein YybS (DUF2232 family)
MAKAKDFLLVVGVGLAAALAAGALMFVPVLSIAVVVVPAVFILLSLRRGFWSGVAGLCVFCIVYAVLISPIAGGTLFLLMIFLVAGVPLMLRQQRPYMEYLAMSAGFSLVSLLAVMGGYAVITGHSLFNALVNAAETFLKANQDVFTPFLDSYRNAGWIDPGTSPAEFVSLLVSMLKDMAPLVPAFLVTLAATVGTLNLMIPYRLAVRKDIRLPDIPSFSRWRLPRGTMWGFIIMAVLSLLLMLINQPTGQTVLYTVSSLFLFLFSVQGLSVAAYLMRRGNLHPVLRVILCILLYIFLSTLLFVVGVFEQLLHIREIIEHMKDQQHGGMK